MTPLCDDIGAPGTGPPGGGGNVGERVRVHLYTVSKPTGNEWPGRAGGGGERKLVQWYTLEQQTVRLRYHGNERPAEEDAASVERGSLVLERVDFARIERHQAFALAPVSPSLFAHR